MNPQDDTQNSSNTPQDYAASDENTQNKSTQPIVAQTTPISSVSAADAELIEKEWVYRAEEIVDGTRKNPHQQSEQLGAIKAEYIKKRYGRDIKAE